MTITPPSCKILETILSQTILDRLFIKYSDEFRREILPFGRFDKDIQFVIASVYIMDVENPVDNVENPLFQLQKTGKTLFQRPMHFPREINLCQPGDDSSQGDDPQKNKKSRRDHFLFIPKTPKNRDHGEKKGEKRKKAVNISYKQVESGDSCVIIRTVP